MLLHPSEKVKKKVLIGKKKEHKLSRHVRHKIIFSVIKKTSYVSRAKTLLCS